MEPESEGGLAGWLRAGWMRYGVSVNVVCGWLDSCLPGRERLRTRQPSELSFRWALGLIHGSIEQGRSR